MRLSTIMLASLLAFPAAAQTTNDDTVSAENWWDEVGAGFFSDATLTTPRPEYEIRAHWTALSADDQAAVRARCAEGAAKAPSRQEGDEDESPDATAADLADPAATVEEGADQTDRNADTTQGGAAATAGETAQTETADDTTISGSVAGAEVQEASPSATPQAETGLAGSSDPRLVTICQLIRDL